MAYFNAVYDRPVKDIIGTVQINHLLHRSCVNTGETLNSRQQVPVRAWIIHGPVTGKWTAVAHSETRIVGIAVDIGIAQARTDPLRFLIPVRGFRETFVLEGGVFLKRPLCAENAPYAKETEDTHSEPGAETHTQHVSSASE